MSANSAVQHLASGLGAALGGRIVFLTPDGALHNFYIVGFISVAATLGSLWLAGLVRPAGEKRAERTDWEGTPAEVAEGRFVE
jgi:hypothetical protein